MCVVLCLGIADGNGLDVVFEWKELDFAYPNSSARQAAVKSRSFIPSHNVPVGLEVWKNKLFITVPRWKPGVSASLTYVDLNQTCKKMVVNVTHYFFVRMFRRITALFTYKCL
jgi:hypothetical protein